MAHFLVLQWNSDCAHLVDATTKGKDLVIQRVATLVGDPEEMRAQFVAKVEEWRISKASTLVAVGRHECELRVLNVPPVPENELPELVRFQSMQQFSSFGDEWPLDYVPLSTDPVDLVLAAAVPPAFIDRIENVCDEAGVQLTGAILRPCGTAMLAHRASPGTTGNHTLIVDIIGNDADLIVARNSSVLMSRSLKLPVAGDGDSDQDYDFAAILLGEVHRTLAAQRSQFPTAKVDRVVICGNSADDVELKEHLNERLNLPAECISPFEGFTLSRELRREIPGNASSFVPLLGLLLEETSDENHSIDFVRPRKPTPPKDTRSFWTAVATLVLAIGFLGAVGWWWALGQRDEELAQLRKDIREADERVKVVQDQQREVEALDDWYRKSPNWLDEITFVSKQLPESEKLRLERFQADVTADGGRIVLKGYVNESSTVTQIETRLRDVQHRLSGVGRSETSEDPKYPWYFTEQIDIDPTREPEPAPVNGTAVETGQAAIPPVQEGAGS